MCIVSFTYDDNIRGNNDSRMNHHNILNRNQI